MAIFMNYGLLTQHAPETLHLLTRRSLLFINAITTWTNMMMMMMTYFIPLTSNYVCYAYSLRRSEILAAAIHEYTDWERPVQHPISVRDETLNALADAQVSL